MKLTLKSPTKLSGIALAILPVLTPTLLDAVEDRQLVWSDEFDYVGLPNPDNWSYDVGGWGWGNGEFQYYTEAREENARVDGENLIIEMHKERYEGRDYTSARLLTKDKHDWEFGRVEARIKVPAGVGLWPAFWMLGAKFPDTSWPDCGEIDIMEFVGREPYEIFGTIHGPRYSGGLSFGDTYTLDEEVSDDFHIFAVEWQPDLIRWYIDGIHYHTATPEDIIGTGRQPNEWVFNQPFFMILNVAIGGTFGGVISPDIEFPVQMLVDYVRVYEVLNETDYGMFNGYPITDSWADTGDFMGWISLADYPWIYIQAMDAWAYAEGGDESGGWTYVLK